MKATFLIAASLIAGAAMAQTTAPEAIPPTATTPVPPPTDTAMPAPAPAPDATSVSPSPSASSVAPPPPDTTNYPPCSASVHDRCVQTHELARKAGVSHRRHR